MITGIVATSLDYVIGKDGKIPWHYPSDLRHFKERTIGKTVVMGRRTYDSIGHPLPDRMNIVLTSYGINERDEPNIIAMSWKQQVLAYEKYTGADVYVIGGSDIYKTFKTFINKWIVTWVPKKISEGKESETKIDSDFLNGFERDSMSIPYDLEEDLIVKHYSRKEPVQ
jgi:dihydrofolate reductase